MWALKISDLWNTDKQLNIELICKILYDPTDVDNIMKMYIPRHDKEDKRVWFRDKSGQLSTKSAFRILSNDGRPQTWKI